MVAVDACDCHVPDEVDRAERRLGVLDRGRGASERAATLGRVQAHREAVRGRRLLTRGGRARGSLGSRRVRGSSFIAAPSLAPRPHGVMILAPGAPVAEGSPASIAMSPAPSIRASAAGSTGGRTAWRSALRRSAPTRVASESAPRASPRQPGLIWRSGSQLRQRLGHAISGRLIDGGVPALRPVAARAGEPLARSAPSAPNSVRLSSRFAIRISRAISNSSNVRRSFTRQNTVVATLRLSSSPWRRSAAKCCEAPLEFSSSASRSLPTVRSCSAQQLEQPHPRGMAQRPKQLRLQAIYRVPPNIGAPGRPLTIVAHDGPDGDRPSQDQSDTHGSYRTTSKDT